MYQKRASVAIGFALLFSSCSRSAADYVERGNRAFEEKRYEAAVLEYRSAIKQDANSGEAHYRLGLAKLEQRDALEAYRALRRASELLPQRDEVRVKLGDVALGLYLESGLRATALQREIKDIGEALLQKDPNSFDGLRLLGYLALTGKDAFTALDLFSKAGKQKPDSVEVLMARAQAHFLNGQFPEGEALARQSIQAQPGYLPPYTFLYDYYRTSKRPSDADAIARQRAKNNPKDLQSQLLLAQHFAATGNPAELNRIVDTVLGNTADFPNARLAVGDFFRKNGQAEQALNHYRAGRQSATDRAAVSEYLRRIGDTNFLLGKYDEALAAAKEALANNGEDLDAALLQSRVMIATGKPELIDQALDALQARRKSHADNADLRFQIGSAYFKKERWSESRAEILEAVKLKPGDRAQLLALAAVCQKLGAHADVVNYASAALRLAPDDASARLLLASGYIGAGRANEARQELNSLLRDQPNYGAALLQMALLNISQQRYREADATLARLYTPGKSDPQVIRAIVRSKAMQRQFDSAQQLLEQEIKLSSNPAELRSLLASVDLAAGRSEKAVAGLQLALSEKPDVPDYHLQLAIAHKQRKDLDQAASVLDAAVQKFPKDDRVLWESVAITEQRGDRQKALERYRMLQQLTPENANVLNNIAFSLAELGRDLDEALSLAERAVRQDPQSPGFADTLAWVQLKRGNTEAALRTFQNLVQRFPDDAGYQEHLKAAQAAQKR